MTKVSGSFRAKAHWQATASIPDKGSHDIGVVEIAGRQTSSDPKWNDAAITYWGMADLTDGSGPQRGYFHNAHADGDQDWGSFEGKITTSGQEVTIEGTWEYTGGTGKFQRISGNGSYKGRMTSPTEVAAEWAGEYQL
jgi:hypothetical protein